MKVIYIADGGGHFLSEMSVYQKRLKGLVEFIQIRPVKHGDRDFIVKQETLKILEILSKYRQKACILDEFGKEFTTMEFSSHLQNKYDNLGIEPIFVVGGAYGLDRNLIAPNMEEIISISQFTLPHGLALLVLAEQLYRIHEIRKGSKYHHI